MSGTLADRERAGLKIAFQNGLVLQMQGLGAYEVSAHEAVDDGFLSLHGMEESHLHAPQDAQPAAANRAGDCSIACDGEIAIADNAAAHEFALDSEIITLDGHPSDPPPGVDVDISQGPDAAVADGVELIVLERDGGGATGAHRGQGLLGDALREVALKAVDVAVSLAGDGRKEAGEACKGWMVSSWCVGNRRWSRRLLGRGGALVVPLTPCREKLQLPHVRSLFVPLPEPFWARFPEFFGVVCKLITEGKRIRGGRHLGDGFPIFNSVVCAARPFSTECGTGE